MIHKEIRIGNWVGVLGEEKQVLGVDAKLRPDVGYFQFESIPPQEILTHPTKGIHVKPIQLTDDRFLSFGFTKEKDDYVGMGEVFCFRKEEFGPQVRMYIHEDGYYSLYAYNDIKCSIQYVHQLQNLYYALTGEELVLRDGTSAEMGEKN